jgi:catechol 2,3-dioxygenase-like lactoylglutathione lyase family enzyme
LSIITLGVADLDRAGAFYRDALGWSPAPQSGGDILFFQAGGVVLALYPRPLLAKEAKVADAGAPGFAGFALAQNVRRREDVDRVLGEVAGKGARILSPAEDAFWGGRSGYFADPDGNVWEVAWNPGFPLDADGTIRLEPAAKARPRRPASPRRRARTGRARTAGAQRGRRRGRTAR